MGTPGFSNGEPLLLVMLLAFIWLGAFGFGYMFMRDMTSMARVMEEARKNPAAIESVDLKECDNGVLAVMVTMRDARNHGRLPSERSAPCACGTSC
jgi:hypothetical protein